MSLASGRAWSFPFTLSVSWQIVFVLNFPQIIHFEWAASYRENKTEVDRKDAIGVRVKRILPSSDLSKA
jgi:hypothetical protein